MDSLPLSSGLLPGLVLAGCCTGAPAPSPWPPLALHPDNPHYFLWRGKPTVLVTSGEHYGAVLNLDFDFRTYLRTLGADGLNLTRTFAGTYREIPGSFGITDNPLAPKPLRYQAPWARSDQPGYVDGGNRFDLGRWDPAYFERLHAFMAAASEAGVVVELNLFCTFYDDKLWEACPMSASANVNGVGACPRTEALTLRHPDLLEVQLAFVRKVVTELSGYDNLYYEVCNEPYFHGVAPEWQSRIADEIAAVEAALGRRHLVSMNIANGRQKVEAPHPAVHILNFHYCTPPDTVALNYGLGRVIGENETGFRGSADLLYRTEGWDFLMAAGGLYNNLDYSFTPAHPDGTLRGYASPGGGSPELRRQLGVLKRFFDGLDFVRMAPAAGLVRETVPSLSVYALAHPAGSWAGCLHVPIPNKPREIGELTGELEADLVLDLPGGDYHLEWVSPLTGETVAGEDIPHPGGACRVRTPRFSVDLAFRLRRR